VVRTCLPSLSVSQFTRRRSWLGVLMDELRDVLGGRYDDETGSFRVDIGEVELLMIVEMPC